VDLENQVAAAVLPLDNLRIDAHVVAAAPAIHFDDALGVGLHRRHAQRPARFRLNFCGKDFVLDLLVALESDPVDHRVLDDGHDQAAAAAHVDLDVGEKPGRVERLQRVVNLDRIDALARANADIAADRFDIDAAIALHDDGADGLRARDARGHDGVSGDGGCPGKRQRRYDRKSPQDTDQKFHAIRYLPSPPGDNARANLIASGYRCTRIRSAQ